MDAAGVHPLLLAVGSERYTPYMPARQPAELLTIANHILGTGQLSLAKFLFITADEENRVTTHNIAEYFSFLLKRINLERDVHFHTHTTIDTLDYSGTGLNTGSKVVFAAYGDPVRSLCTELPVPLKEMTGVENMQLIMPGVVAIQTGSYANATDAANTFRIINGQLSEQLEQLRDLPLIVWCDDAAFTAASLRNFLWVTFTRSNPSHDIHGIASFTENKHWGCKGPLVIDARIKPHHAPVLETDSSVEKKIDGLFAKGGSLYGKLK
ncbi:MAG: hypothetical protein ACO1NW_07500 [Chitinophagaceae bacterium]